MKLMKNIALVMAFVSASFGASATRPPLKGMICNFFIQHGPKIEPRQLLREFLEYANLLWAVKPGPEMKGFGRWLKNDVWGYNAENRALYKKIMAPRTFYRDDITLAFKRHFVIALVRTILARDMAMEYDSQNPRSYNWVNPYKLGKAHLKRFLKNLFLLDCYLTTKIVVVFAVLGFNPFAYVPDTAKIKVYNSFAELFNKNFPDNEQ